MTLAVTAGEPAGIGPDVLVSLAQAPRSLPYVVVASAAMLSARAALLDLPLAIDADLSTPSGEPGRLTVLDMPLAAEVVAGRLNVANASGTLAALARALDGVVAGQFSGLVTGPMQKSIINDAGIPFTGHTEYLCQHSGADDVVMLLVAKQLRVALATTHLPLRDVADALSVSLVTRRARILAKELKDHFGIARPRIGVTGLNPHAGEGGHLGSEEIEIITPACEQLARDGIDVTGPLPADTLFTPERLKAFDAVLAMYHDQGLPVLKFAGFGEAVNVTLGLGFVRTSVDHGTALDIAGTGGADTGSFAAALALAHSLTHSSVPG